LQLPHVLRISSEHARNTTCRGRQSGTSDCFSTASLFNDGSGYEIGLCTDSLRNADRVSLPRDETQSANPVVRLL
jgi:hypothetical protein